MCHSLIVYGCGFEPSSSSVVANAGEMTWKTDVWARAKVVSGKTVREKQEADYLSDLLDSEEINSRAEDSHKAGITLNFGFRQVLASFCKAYMSSCWFPRASTE